MRAVGSKNLSRATIGWMKRLRREGLSLREIAAMVGRDHTTVYYHCAEVDEMNPYAQYLVHRGAGL